LRSHQRRVDSIGDGIAQILSGLKGLRILFILHIIQEYAPIALDSSFYGSCRPSTNGRHIRPGDQSIARSEYDVIFVPRTSVGLTGLNVREVPVDALIVEYVSGYVVQITAGLFNVGRNPPIETRGFIFGAVAKLVKDIGLDQRGLRVAARNEDGQLTRVLAQVK
jgi:hypothetical protein